MAVGSVSRELSLLAPHRRPSLGDELVRYPRVEAVGHLAGRAAVAGVEPNRTGFVLWMLR